MIAQGLVFLLMTACAVLLIGTEAATALAFSSAYGDPDSWTRHVWTAGAVGASLGTSAGLILFTRRKGLERFLSAVLFLVCFGWGAWNAYGFAAQETARRDAINTAHAVALKPYRNAEAERNAIPYVTSVKALGGKLARLRANKRWKTTKGCTDATAPASVALCERFERIQDQLANAARRDELDAFLAGEPVHVDAEARGYDQWTQAAFSLFVQVTGAIILFCIVGTPTTVPAPSPVVEKTPEAGSPSLTSTTPPEEHVVTSEKVVARKTKRAPKAANRNDPPVDAVAGFLSEALEERPEIKGITYKDGGFFAGQRTIMRGAKLRSVSQVNRVLQELANSGRFLVEATPDGTFVAAAA